MFSKILFSITTNYISWRVLLKKQSSVFFNHKNFSPWATDFFALLPLHGVGYKFISTTIGNCIYMRIAYVFDRLTCVRVLSICPYILNIYWHRNMFITICVYLHELPIRIINYKIDWCQNTMFFKSLTFRVNFIHFEIYPFS